jgi:hypothetical protein
MFDDDIRGEMSGTLNVPNKVSSNTRPCPSNFCGDISDLHGLSSDGLKSITNYVEMAHDKIIQEEDSSCSLCSTQEEEVNEHTPRRRDSTSNDYMHLELVWVHEFHQTAREV